MWRKPINHKSHIYLNFLFPVDDDELRGLMPNPDSILPLHPWTAEEEDQEEGEWSERLMRREGGGNKKSSRLRPESVEMDASQVRGIKVFFNKNYGKFHVFVFHIFSQATTMSQLPSAEAVMSLCSSSPADEEEEEEEVEEDTSLGDFNGDRNGGGGRKKGRRRRPPPPPVPAPR